MMWGAWSGSWFPWWFLFPLMMLGMGLMMWFMMRMMGMGMGGHDHASGHTDTPPPNRDPRSILDERYARGELTREQYQQMRDDLNA